MPAPSSSAVCRRGVEPRFVRDLPEFAIYPDGYDVEQLGTFPRP